MSYSVTSTFDTLLICKDVVTVKGVQVSEMQSAIDRKIATYCVVHKMSQDSFAKLIGISAKSLYSKRMGYSDWKLSEVNKLCSILDESPDSLVNW